MEKGPCITPIKGAIQGKAQYSQLNVRGVMSRSFVAWKLNVLEMYIATACIGDTVRLNNLTDTFTSHGWTYGNGNGSIDYRIYKNIGVYPVQLWATRTNLTQLGGVVTCSDKSKNKNETINNKFDTVQNTFEVQMNKQNEKICTDFEKIMKQQQYQSNQIIIHKISK